MELQLMQLRKKAGFKNRDDFAAYIGVNKYTYRSWEQSNAMMSLEQAVRVCNALNCSLDELVGRSIKRTYSDSGQEIINVCYESMNERGRDTLVNVATSLERDVSNRISKNRGQSLLDTSNEDVA